MRKFGFALLATTGLVASLHGAPVMAQEVAADGAVPAPAAGGGAIVVTGSRIGRPNTTAAAPITSVSNEQIRLQAAVNIEEVLNRIPQIAPDSQQNYGDSDGRQRIKLRNLGFERTLVLVDGKRLGTVNGLDANIIPTSLVQRVDVLTGGASAVYGSDAIAGVVNFVLDDNFEGVQLNANYNFYLHDNQRTFVSDVAEQYNFGEIPSGLDADGGRIDLSLTVGQKFLDDRFHVSAFANYREADLVALSDRSSAACALTETAVDGPLTCGTSTYTPFGYISPRVGAANGQAFVNNPDGSGTLLPYGDAYAANPYDGASFQRKSNRINLGGFTRFEIVPEAELYANVLWFSDRSSNPFPARILSGTAYDGGNGIYNVNCNNPLLSEAQAQAICGAGAGSGTLAPVELRYRANNVNPINDSYRNQGLRLSGGVRGDFAEAWNYDLGVVYSKSRQDITWGRPVFDRVNQALNAVSVNGEVQCAPGAEAGCLPLDVFSPNSALNNQTLFNWLLIGGYGTQTTRSELFDVIGTVQGDLGTYGITSPWADQGVAIAFGGEYRKDTLRGTADAVWRDQYGGRDSDLSQDVWEGNVELQVPIVENRPWFDLLQFNGAYRLSKYSSNPDTFSTWKAEAIWSPVSDITFRGSINRAQRAPTVVEANQAGTISFDRTVATFVDICAPTVTYATDPATGQQVPVYGSPTASREVCAATGLADNLYGSPSLVCPTDIGCTVRRGGYTVDPETAYTYTFGVVLRPTFVPGLTVSVDRFLINLDDSIGYNDFDYFSNGCLATGNDFFCSQFVRAADGTLYSAPDGNPTSGFLRGGTTNYYRSKSHGWDFQGQYALPLGAAGDVAMDFVGSLTTLAGGQDSPILPEYNCVGYYGGGCGQLLPKWTHSFRTTYTTADDVFSASLNWRYVGPLTNVTNSGRPELGGTPANERDTFYRLGSQNYFDLALTYRLQERYTVRLSANNIFDNTPPLLPNSYSYGLSRSNTINARYDSLGRQIAVGFTADF